MILALVQTKGGTGKTTLSVCIAYSSQIRRKFNKIALVEFDPQGNLLDWYHDRESSDVYFSFIYADDPDIIRKELGELERNFDMIILDVPGESVGRFHTKFACAVADIVLIPLRTSTYDEAAFFNNLLPIIDQIQSSNVSNKFLVIPSFIHPVSNPLTAINYLSEILPDNISCLHAIFPVRSIFENFNRFGLTLNEFKQTLNNKISVKQADKAIADIDRIVDALFP